MTTPTFTVTSAGCRMEVVGEDLGTFRAQLAATGVDGPEVRPREAAPDLRVVLERSRRPYDVRGMRPVTRGVWFDGSGRLVVEDAGGSGFAQHWTFGAGPVVLRARWAPGPRARLAARALPTRFRALRAQVLLHHPALAWGTLHHGWAPVHVSTLRVGHQVVLLAGPAGVGKSTLVAREVLTGAEATCDNVAASDGTYVHGLAEPLRLPRSRAAHGPAAAHGRVEVPWPRRAPVLRPDLVVVVERAATGSLSRIEPDVARRAISAGTYHAGELARLWPTVATLALALGRGPVHPVVDEIAGRLAAAGPCLRLVVADGEERPLPVLLAEPLREERRAPA